MVLIHYVRMIYVSEASRKCGGLRRVFTKSKDSSVVYFSCFKIQDAPVAKRANNQWWNIYG